MSDVDLRVVTTMNLRRRASFTHVMQINIARRQL